MFHVLMFGLIFTSTLVLGIVGANRIHHRVSRLREEPVAVRESRARVVRSRSVVLVCVGFLMPLSLLVLPDPPSLHRNRLGPLNSHVEFPRFRRHPFCL